MVGTHFSPRTRRPPPSSDPATRGRMFGGLWVGFLLIACCSHLVGCGYKLVRPESVPGASGSGLRVAVPALTNDSFDPTVAGLLTDALRREVLRRGSATLVDPKAAEILVVGEIRDVDTFVTSVSSVSAALEQQLEVTVDLRAERRDGSEIELANTSYIEWELYLESADLEAARKNRDEALRRVAAVIAMRFHDVLNAGLRP